MARTAPDNTVLSHRQVEDPWRSFERRLDALEHENQQLREEVQLLSGLPERFDALDRAPGLRPLHEYPFPEQHSFCGEPIPLDDPEVRGRFEAELNRFLVNRHWVVGWMRRSRDAFPHVERQLEEAGLPTDLRYVMVIESALDPRATSAAGAAGYWQFTKPTGKGFGLDRTRYLDQRRDLYEATGAAIRYLTALYTKFESWPLALSAYNAGERRVRDAIETQNVSDFYRLYLPRETEAYWFKAAAVKLLFEAPEEYDLALPDHGWFATSCDTLLMVGRSDEYAIKDFLGESGMDYRRFKQLNPSYRRGFLPRGSHRLAIPAEYAEAIHSAHPKAQLITSRSATQPAR